MSKRFLDNDSGTAYGLLIVASFILLAGSVYIIFLPMFNKFIAVANIFIAQDMVSQDTSDALSFNFTVVGALTIFMVLGVVAWGIVRALEKKEQGG